MSKYTENFPNLSTYDFDTIMCQLRQVCAADPSGLINVQFLSRPTTAKDIALLLHITYELFQSQVELQKQFVELYTFVKDFFENLDLQEEVNNKLEEMYQSGELSSLLANLRVYNFYGKNVPEDDAFSFIQNVFNNNDIIIFDGRTYNVSIPENDSGLVVENKTIIGNGTTLVMNKNNFERQQFLLIKDNTHILNLNLIGDRETHEFISDSTNEWGRGFVVRGKNVSLKFCTATYFTGDCFNIYDSENVVIEMCNGSFCRRNGISCGNNKNVVISNVNLDSIGTATSNAGTLPKMGIDIEPNEIPLTDTYVIKNCNITNCPGGAIGVQERANETCVIDVKIDSVKSTNCPSFLTTALFVRENENNRGNIEVNNCYSEFIGNWCFYLDRFFITKISNSEFKATGLSTACIRGSYDIYINNVKCEMDTFAQGDKTPFILILNEREDINLLKNVQVNNFESTGHYCSCVLAPYTGGSFNKVENSFINNCKCIFTGPNLGVFPEVVGVECNENYKVSKISSVPGNFIKINGAIQDIEIGDNKYIKQSSKINVSTLDAIYNNGWEFHNYDSFVILYIDDTYYCRIAKNEIIIPKQFIEQFKPLFKYGYFYLSQAEESTPDIYIINDSGNVQKIN